MGFIIAGCVIALILLILLLRIRLSLSYRDGDAGITVKILFLRFHIVGKEKKKPKKSDFKIKKFRRRTKKVLAKYRRKRLEKLKKAANKNKEPETRSEKASPAELVDKAIYIFGDVIKSFPRYLSIDCLTLVVGVGGEDAASVAVNYGVTVQSVQYLATLLNGVTNFKAKKDARVSVYPEFASGKWTADISFVFGLRVIHILKLGFILLKRYIKYKLKGKNEVKNKSPREDKAA